MTEKIDNFDREFRALMNQSAEILSIRYGISNTIKARKETVCLERFESIYDKLPASEFYIHFTKLFERKRNLIIKSLDNDAWLKNGNIVIQFGEGVQELRGKCDNIKILLSNIYNCAVELRESSKNTFSDFSEELARQDVNIIKPSIILLHLMRIFYYIVDNEDDKLALSIIVNTLEEDLSVKNKTVRPVSPLTNPLASLSSNTEMISDTLSTIFSTLSTIAKQVGIEGMDELQAPTGKQIKEGLDSTINNEQIQSSISTLMQSVNNKEDMVSSITNFAKTVLTPEMIATMQNGLLKTAQIAKDNSINH